MGKKVKHRGPLRKTSTSTWQDSSAVQSTTSQIDEETDDNLTKASSKDSLERLDERSDLEKQLFELIEDGNVPVLCDLISRFKDDINASNKDLNGHDLLTQAVESGKKKIVNLVLAIDSVTDTKEALLHAIKAGKLAIVLKLLKFEDNRKQLSLRGSGSGSKPRQRVRKRNVYVDKDGNKITIPEAFDESEFGGEMTPLIMAVLHGHFEIMDVLYNRGERVPEPHVPSCSCPDCKSATRDVERTQRRMNILKARSSAEYLIFMTGHDAYFDPIFHAYELCSVIKQCAKEEPENVDEYKEILKVARKVPVDLMNMCRSTDETKILLTQTEGYVGPSSILYPRLALAIERGHKKFVAHPNVQFLLQSEYYGPVWKSSKTNLNKALKLIVTLLMMVFFPLVQIFLWFALFCCKNVTLIKFLSSPANKSMSKLASYIYFCIALAYMNMEERPEADIEPPTLYVRWLVMLYVVSLLLALFRRFMYHPRAFFKSGWNIFDLVTQAAFWLTFSIWIYLFLRKRELGYEQTLSRRKLPCDDPLLIEECAFAVASVFATIRLTKWFVLSTSVGPFQAALYRMGAVVWIVIIYVAWIVLTFGLSANILVRPYANLSKYDEKDLKMKEQPTDSMEIPKLMVAFLADSALSPNEYEIFTTNRSYIDPDGKQAFVENEPETTQWFSTFFCVLFNVVVMTFLKDSVIGLFGSKGEEVLEAKNVEWKYDRAKEMLYYIQDGHLAPPFNLIPNGGCMGSICSWCAGLTCSRRKKKAGCDCTQCCYVQRIESPEEIKEKSRKYAFLMRKLFQRYLKAQANKESERATENTVEEVFVTLEDVRKLCKEIFEPEASKPSSSRPAISRTQSQQKPATGSSQPNKTPTKTDSVKVIKKPDAKGQTKR